MATTLTSKSAIHINAPRTKVWEALTRPELIKQWFFGVDTVSDWKVGSPLVHTGSYQGKPYEDKGNILEITPPEVLTSSHWSKGSGLPDEPDNYQHVTFALAEQGGGTDLTLDEINLPNEKAKEISDKSWQQVLGSLKQLLEKQPAAAH
jgi:uncharacterized protein YndB with AHSA1/START domain